MQTHNGVINFDRPKSHPQLLFATAHIDSAVYNCMTPSQQKLSLCSFAFDTNNQSFKCPFSSIDLREAPQAVCLSTCSPTPIHTMPITEIDMSLNENTRGKPNNQEACPSAADSLPPVLGQDPLIPPQLLQSEVPGVCPFTRSRIGQQLTFVTHAVGEDLRGCR